MWEHLPSTTKRLRMRGAVRLMDAHARHKMDAESVHYAGPPPRRELVCPAGPHRVHEAQPMRGGGLAEDARRHGVRKRIR